jgi:tetratricopeptide (TPR) repeat protein
MKKFVLMVVALMAVSFAQAQSVVENYNAATKAVEAKDYAKAAQLFESVINDGSEEEDATIAGCVKNAQSNLPVVYTRMGSAAAAAASKATDAKVKDAKFAEAIAHLEKAVAKAKSFRNTKAATAASNMIGKVYQVQGGTYFNGGDYAKAIEIFAKGYTADKKNTALAMMLAESYFKSNNYAEGVKVCSEVAALPSPKYDAAIAEAKGKMSQYTNNKIAELQKANDFDGVIALAETITDKALAQKVLVQAYFLKKDYAKVIEIGEAAAALQTDDESKSAVYFNLGSAYNAKENKAKAIECLKKVTAEPYATPAKAAVAELSK